MNTDITKTAVKQHFFNTTRLLLVVGMSCVLFFLLTERALAEDLRDQQDRMRNEYYQHQDTQREMNRMRDHEELRQTQTNQAIQYREQDIQMKKAAKKIQQRAHPYEPEIISHDRGLNTNQEDNKGSKTAPESDQKQIGEMPKVNVDKLLEGN